LSHNITDNKVIFENIIFYVKFKFVFKVWIGNWRRTAMAAMMADCLMIHRIPLPIPSIVAVPVTPQPKEFASKRAATDGENIDITTRQFVLFVPHPKLCQLNNFIYGILFFWQFLF
jgi:hypothetical protein